MNNNLIYHIFADTGIESEILSNYGKVIRIGLNPTKNSYDDAIKADANNIPLQKEADLVFLQPECKKWSLLGNGNGKNQIELARELGKDLGKDYIIENVPRNDEIRQDISLYGSQFNLPLVYQRVFECSFNIDSTPSYDKPEVTYSVRESHRKSKEWWQKVKGYNTKRDRKDIVVKEGIPAHYVKFLVEKWLES